MCDHLSFTKILTAMAETGKLSQIHLTSQQSKVIQHMMECHTEVCGFTREECENCGLTAVHYGSCNDVNCPQCGALKRAQWAASQKRKVVNAPYFHIIFTVPDKYLNRLFLHDPGFMFNCILDASAKTLKKFSKDPKFLGVVTPGFFSVLHSWGSTLSEHVHVHTLFCGAGIDNNGNVKVVKKDDYLFPVKAVAKLFKGEFLKLVCQKYEYTDSPWMNDLNDASAEDNWNVEIKPCKGDPAHVIEYTARYINRTAISNARLVSYKNGKVRFTYKDYKQNGKIREMELADTEFIRRFCMHIFPKGFRRCRHYGFLGNNASQKLKKVQEATGTVIPDTCEPDRNILPLGDLEDEELELALEKKILEYGICPGCGCKMTVLESRPRKSRKERMSVNELASAPG